MEQKCELCDKVFDNFLEHLYFTHNIKNAEEYESRVSERKSKIEKTERYQQQVRELANRLSLKEITPEEYRRRVVNIERE